MEAMWVIIDNATGKSRITDERQILPDHAVIHEASSCRARSHPTKKEQEIHLLIDMKIRPCGLT